MATRTNLRRLPLQGAVNTRDLGGYPTIDGGVTRWNTLLRSDGVQALLPEDITILREYGVTDALDLRSKNECAEKPSLLKTAEGFTGHEVHMLDNIMSGGDMPFPDTLGELYVGMLNHGGEDFAKGMRVILNAKGGVLFHCAVGKDRTGMTAMLLLKLAGVYDADVVADYTASEIYLAELLAGQLAQLEAAGIPTSLLKSAPENMQKALAHLHSTWGSAEAYLAGAGMTQEELAALKAKILA